MVQSRSRPSDGSRRSTSWAVRLPRHAPSGARAAAPQWLIAGDGRILHSTADRLLVDVYNAAGRHVQRFGFDVTPRRVTDAEFTRGRASLHPEEMIVGAHAGRLVLSTVAGLVWMRKR
jgi:hypothetical protein